MLGCFLPLLVLCSIPASALVNVALDKPVLEVFSGSGANSTLPTPTPSVGWFSTAFPDFPDKALYPETLLLDLQDVYNVSTILFTPPLPPAASSLPMNFSLHLGIPGQAAWALAGSYYFPPPAAPIAAFPASLARYLKVTVNAVSAQAPPYTLSVGRLQVLGDAQALPTPPLAWPPPARPFTPPRPARLQAEWRDSPIDIDAPNPLLSWVLESTREGDMVTAYQVVLNRSSLTIWDTGRVAGRAYSTPPLPPVPLAAGGTLSWSVRLWDASGAPTAWAPPARFSMAKLRAQDWRAGQWIGGDKALVVPGVYGPGHPAVYLRGSFALSAAPTRAVAYFSGLGWGKLYVNGALAHSTLELSPGYTTYTARTQYNVFDVTPLLQAPGQVVLAAVLGDGWYALAHDSSCCAQFQHQAYVNSTRMLLEVQLWFADGSTLAVGSNASWQWALGEITSTHFNGESVDKTCALPSNWAGSMSAGAGGSGGAACAPPWGAWRPVLMLDGPPALFNGSFLTSQKEPPTTSGLLALQAQTVRTVAEPSGGGGVVTVFDFGREIQGRVVLTASATAPSLRVRALVCGSFYLTRAFTCDEYTNSSLSNAQGPGLYNFTLLGSGAVETYRPLFTYAALRRVVVHVPAGVQLHSCIAESLVMEQPETGAFASSSPTYNWLQAALARTQLHYTTGFPNDPSRERVGYTQDVMNMFRGAAFHFGPSSNAMYARWLGDMADGQAYAQVHPGQGIPPGAGQMPTVIPGPKSDGANSVWWGGMVAWLPWRHFLHYGDSRILRAFYGNARAYVEYLNASSPNATVAWGLADWNSPLGQCSGWGFRGANQAINTPGLYLLARVLADIAAFLGEAGDAARFSALAAATATSFNAAFLNASSGAYAWGEQCHQVMALAQEGLVPPPARSAVVQALRHRIAADNTTLTVGFVSFLHAVLALADEDPDLLHALITARNYGPREAPGACTDADSPGAHTVAWGCAPSPYSNSVGAFPSSDLMKESWQGADAMMPSLAGPLLLHSYHTLAGIRDPETLAGAGFASFDIVIPQRVRGVQWVEARHASPLGDVHVSWAVVSGGASFPAPAALLVEVIVPPGASAMVRLPCSGGGAQHPVRAGQFFFNCSL